MKIGLIIFSQTGNTRHVAEKLENVLREKGEDVTLEEIKISGKTPAQSGKFELTHSPSTEQYDALIFGAPVQAFSLNPVMKTYLEKLPSLKGKKVALFVTKQLPLIRLGGTGAISTMEKICAARGASIIGTEIVVWSEKKRAASIRSCLEKMGRLFT